MRGVSCQQNFGIIRVDKIIIILLVTAIAFFMMSSVSATESFVPQNSFSTQSNGFVNDFSFTTGPTFVPISPPIKNPVMPDSNNEANEIEIPGAANPFSTDPKDSFLNPVSPIIEPVGKEPGSSSNASYETISSKERALAFVRAEIARYAAFGAPGSIPYYEPDWSLLTVDPEPVLISSLHGVPLYYEFSLLQDGNWETSILVNVPVTPEDAVRVISIDRGGNYHDYDELYRVAIDLVKEKYPDSTIGEGMLVEYVIPHSYSSWGYLFTFQDQKTGITQKVIVDVFYHCIMYSG